MSSDTSTTDDGAQNGDTVSSRALNEDALVGLAADEDELSWRYKTALAPDSYKRHDECGEIDDEYYTKTLEVRDWPAIPRHGFFDKLASFQMPQVDVTISTHLTGEDKREADRKLADTADSLKQKVRSLAKNKWIPDYFVEQVVGEYADVKRTQNTVSASEYGLYTSNTYIEVRSPDRDDLDTAVKRIRSRMQDVSADAKPLKHHSKLGYQTAAPACKNYLGGNTKMTGDGLSRLIPWTAENLIEPGGIELGTNEDTGDPIILDLQNRETGFNVGIWGTIGSGKTTTLTRLLMRTKMQNPEMPLVIIDPKQEFSGLTWLFDGQTVTIGSDTGINPLQIEKTPRERLEDIGEESPYRNAIRRAMDFVRSYYEYMGIPFEDKQGTWRKAIQEAHHRRGITANPDTHHKDSPTFADDVFPIFEEMVNSPGHFLRDALADVELSKQEMQKTANSILQNDIGALEEGGEFEHLSKETNIDLKNIDVLYLDLQNYENEMTAGLMMGPLLTAVLEQAKEIDEPMALAMDEFHYMLHNSSSLATLKQAYRHSRHSDLSMITATQSVEEFFTENDEGQRQLTESASTLTNLMSVKIWHFLKEMDDEWAGEFDMTDAEQQYIEDASTGDPTAQALLQLQKGGSYRLSVDFSNELNPREFAMNQFDPTDVGTDPLSYLSNYTNRAGRDVTQWTWENLGDHHSSGNGNEQAQAGIELADGTTVTSDVADVEAVPPTETDTDSPEQIADEAPAADDTDTDESTSSTGEGEGDSESESEGRESEKESGGFASRVKESVSSAVGSSDQPTADEADEDPSLTDISTVTAQTAANLQHAGFETVEEVFEADNTALAEADGIDPTKAAFIRRKAAQTLGRSAAIVESPSESTESGDEGDTDENPTMTVEFTPGYEEAEQDVDDDSDGEESATTDSEADGDAAAQPALTDIQEVGEDRADVLRAAGYESVGSVAMAGQDALTEVEGIGGTRAETIAESAASLLDEQPDGAGADAPGDDD